MEKFLEEISDLEIFVNKPGLAKFFESGEKSEVSDFINCQSAHVFLPPAVAETGSPIPILHSLRAELEVLKIKFYIHTLYYLHPSCIRSTSSTFYFPCEFLCSQNFANVINAHCRTFFYEL